MFELLESESVRRSEIYSRSPSFESLTADPNELLQREQLERAYINQQRDWSLSDNNAEQLQIAAETIDVDHGKNDPEAFEFRLFSKDPAPKSSASNEQVSRKIILRSPSPTSGSPGFLIPRRPDAYYFTDVVSAEKQEQLESTTVTGEQIIKGLKDTWRGFELPWRVTTILLAQPKKLSETLQTGDETSSRRKKHGKKRRIAIRKRAAMKEAMESSVRRRKAELETAEKEKRTRKNREKKVKKRQRDKLKKVVTINEPE